MLLAVDVGNPETVVGLYADNESDVFDHWRIATIAERTGDEHALLLSQFLAQHDLTFDDVTGVAVSSRVTFSSAAAWIASHSSGATTPTKLPFCTT